jgi:hypothetical protein
MTVALAIAGIFRFQALRSVDAMQYEASEVAGSPGTWLVRGLDDSGMVHDTTFTGPGAEARAREYEALMRNRWMRMTSTPPRDSRGRMAGGGAPR